MKTLLLLLFFFPCALYAQNFKPGYVGKVRLDSIRAKYAQAEITTGMAMLAGNIVKRFTFDYGQDWKKEEEIRVCDSLGKVITFKSTAEALNFFDYWGWELVQLFFGVGTGGQTILLRRKEN